MTKTNTYFTADLHLGHAGVLRMCRRPFTASVRPCVGRTDPSLSGSQSTWAFITPVFGANRRAGAVARARELGLLAPSGHIR